jgi:excisionase family DNA binding protein
MCSQTPIQKLLKPEEFAERLGIRLSTARAWLLTRRIAKVKVGRRSVRIPEGEVTRLIAEGYVPARENHK